MTVCIAAIAKDGNESVIVSTSDNKITAGGLYSQDLGAFKVRRIHQNWFAMIAGQFSQHRAICEAISSELENIADPSLGEVTKAATNVYVKETRRFAEESILSRYGLSMVEFLGSRKQIGDSLFERTWVEISQINVGCELLMYGFAQYFNMRRAHIFTVSNPTSDKPTFVTEHDSPSFAAIGSGAYAAESIMYSCGHINVRDLATTVYETCVAKCFAETASDVGDMTTVIIMKSDGTNLDVEANLGNWVRDRWRKNRTLAVSQEDVAFVSNLLKQSASQTSAGQR